MKYSFKPNHQRFTIIAHTLNYTLIAKKLCQKNSFSYLLISSGISLILLLFRLRNFRLLSPPKKLQKKITCKYLLTYSK